MDRRNFFKSIAQGGIFSALAGTSVYLLTREKPLNTNDCNFDLICQNCKKNRHCQLPEASIFRKKNLAKS
jgi:hypothetical protein